MSTVFMHCNVYVYKCVLCVCVCTIYNMPSVARPEALVQQGKQTCTHLTACIDVLAKQARGPTTMQMKTCTPTLQYKGSIHNKPELR